MMTQRAWIGGVATAGWCARVRWVCPIQLLDGRRIRRIAIHVDHSQAGLARLQQSKLEKPCAPIRPRFGDRRKSIVLPGNRSI
jgi:hypothetical protein